MEQGIVLSTDDIKKIIAEHFNVDEKQVVKAQYSWIVIKKD